MNLKLHSDDPTQPCRHMESMLNQTADGRSGWLKRWYTLAHAARCTGCRLYYKALMLMKSQLRSAQEEPMPEEVESRLEDALKRAATQRES